MTDEPSSDLWSLRELKAEAGSHPLTATVRGQVEALQLKKTTTGKDYLEVRLTDAEERIILRLWADHPLFTAASSLLARAWIEVSGEWTQNQFGVDLRHGALRSLSAEEAAALLGGPEALRHKQAADYAFIDATVAALADPRLRALGRHFLNTYGERFRRTGAAREYHHARRGGLVEHVAQMMRTAVVVAGVYPELNRDLLVSGVLFHDCGKLWENCYSADGFVMPYDERGELLGHITIGIELVNRLWRTVLESPEAAAWDTLAPANEAVRLHLLHLLGAHHGELQFGSPVWPKTPEAAALHYIDNLDAKLEMMKESYATSTALGPTIFERRRPLPAALVRPLPAMSAAETITPEEPPPGDSD